MNEGLSLLHYGILGMRWGIRRTPEELGHAPRRTIGERIRNRIALSKEKRREQSLKKATKTTVDVSSMSDEELSKVVNRLQLEKRYSDLMSELHPQRQSIAKKFLKDFASKSVDQIGQKMADKFVSRIFASKGSKDAEKFARDFRATKIKDLEKDYSPEDIKRIKKYTSDLVEIRKNLSTLSKDSGG